MQFSFSLPRQRLFLLLKLFLLYLVLFAAQTISADYVYKAGTVIAFQWWDKGTFFISLEATGEDGGKEDDSYSSTPAVLFMVIGPESAGEEVEFSTLSPGDLDETIDENIKKNTFKVTLKKETGYIHIISNSVFNVTPRVNGNAPNGGIVYSQRNDAQDTSSYKRLYKESPFAVLSFNRDEWNKITPAQNNFDEFFQKYDSLTSEINSDDILIVYEVNSGSIKKVSDNASVKQWFSPESQNEKSDAELSMMMASTSMNNQTDKEGGSGITLGIRKKIEEKFHGLDKKNNLLTVTPYNTLKNMMDAYGTVSESFSNALHDLGFNVRKEGVCNIPLFYFLVCARVAGVNTIHGLPGLNEADKYKKDIEDFFINPEYLLWESKQKVSAENGRLDEPAQALYKILKSRGKKKAEHDRSVFSYDGKLSHFLKSTWPAVQFELQEEIGVGGTWLARRVSILTGDRKEAKGEIRIYMADGESVNKFDVVFGLAGELSGNFNNDFIHNPFFNYIGNGISVQVVFPEYYCKHGEVQTLYSLVKKKKISSAEALNYIEKVMELLAYLHANKVVVDYLGPSQIVPIYNRNNDLVRVVLLEIRPGMERLSSGINDVSFIQRDIFQALKIYYLLITGNGLDSNFDLIRDKDYRFSSLGSLQSVFFGDPDGCRNIWNIWLNASGSRNIECDVVKLFAMYNKDWNSAEKILDGIKLLKQKKHAEIMGNGGYQKTINTEGKNLHRYRTWNLKCRKNHVLHMEEVTQVSDKYGTAVECDKCREYTGRKQSLYSGRIMHCSECQFDLCGPCTVDKMQLLALPSEVKCSKNHSMFFSPPGTGQVECQRCRASFQSHHFSCTTCLRSFGSYSLCPQCALAETIKQAVVMSPQNNSPMPYMEVNARDGYHCQHCNVKLGGEGAAFVSDKDDVLCLECAASELRWFGLPSSHFPIPSAKHH